MTYNVWAKSEYGGGFYNDYCERADKTCPQSLFKGSHIKNSSVYSRTDQYRDEDLINTNSHSSLTEKLSYMTDANKEWVNQVGRILRMVLVDIEMHAFSPKFDDNARTYTQFHSNCRNFHRNSLEMHDIPIGYCQKYGACKVWSGSWQFQLRKPCTLTWT